MSATNKTIFITGASSGIGRAIAYHAAQQGYNLILCARRNDRLQEIKHALTPFRTQVITLPLDIQNQKNVALNIESLLSKQKIDVLINNAGLSLGLDPIEHGNTIDWDKMIDTNIKGLLYVTRMFLPAMKQQQSGHIINLGSISGHETYPGGVVYCATKYAVKAINEGLKKEVHGSPIRISMISPGLVNTEFSSVRFSGDTDRANQVYHGMTPLVANDVAECVLFCISRPAHVNISEILVLPTDQSSAIMVNRKMNTNNTQ